MHDRHDRHGRHGRHKHECLVANTVWLWLYMKAADLVKVNETTLSKWMRRKDVIFLLAEHMPNAKRVVTSFSNTHMQHTQHKDT